MVTRRGLARLPAFISIRQVARPQEAGPQERPDEPEQEGRWTGRLCECGRADQSGQVGEDLEREVEPGDCHDRPRALRVDGAPAEADRDDEGCRQRAHPTDGEAEPDADRVERALSPRAALEPEGEHLWHEIRRRKDHRDACEE
jgi:hypothetical protein